MPTCLSDLTDNWCILTIICLQESWLPTLRSLVTQINETFSRNFQEMAVAGEVSLGHCLLSTK